MNQPKNISGFTLVELLVVTSIIGAMVGILLPALASSKDSGRAAQCMANLHSQGQATTCYQQDFKQYFPDYAKYDYPTVGTKTYFWGTDANPVDRNMSWLISYSDTMLYMFLCPSQAWGTYVPQGSNVKEATTNYGYNANCLVPDFSGRTDANGNRMNRKRIDDLAKPGQLQVFADSGMYWRVHLVWTFQNSTWLEPVDLTNNGGTTTPNTTPSSHFRHRGTTQALLADAHAQVFTPAVPASGSTTQPQVSLGYVSSKNYPWYDQ